MVPLHLFMSMYIVKTMLASRCVFHYGNRHNRLIFDPLGCPDTQKLRVSTHVNGLSWRLKNPDHGTTAFIHVYIQCIDYVSLSLRFSLWQQAQLTDIWPSRVPRHPPKIEGVSWTSCPVIFVGLPLKLHMQGRLIQAPSIYYQADALALVR